MEPVGVGRRAVATIIDSILFILFGFVLAFASGGGDAGTLVNILFIVVGFGYYIVLEKVMGATLGKKMMGLRVVTKEGEPIGWMASVIRNVLRFIDGIGMYLIGAIVIWVSKDKQRIGDMAAATIVVRAES